MSQSKQGRYVQSSGSGSTISIDASPGAPKTEVTGVNPWRGALQIKIAAEAREGAANEELISFLSRKLRVSRKDIRLIKGEKSSGKVLFVPLPPEKVRSILGDG